VGAVELENESVEVTLKHSREPSKIEQSRLEQMH